MNLVERDLPFSFDLEVDDAPTACRVDRAFRVAGNLEYAHTREIERIWIAGDVEQPQREQVELVDAQRACELRGCANLP